MNTVTSFRSANSQRSRPSDLSSQRAINRDLGSSGGDYQMGPTASGGGRTGSQSDARLRFGGVSLKVDHLRQSLSRQGSHLDGLIAKGAAEKISNYEQATNVINKTPAGLRSGGVSSFSQVMLARKEPRKVFEDAEGDSSRTPAEHVEQKFALQRRHQTQTASLRAVTDGGRAGGASASGVVTANPSKANLAADKL